MEHRTFFSKYVEWYFSTEVWQKTTYRGVPCLKFASDAWNYQEILTDLKPSLVVEFGTRFGGSALYLADMARCRVLTVDVDQSPVHASVRDHSLIELLEADTRSPTVAAHISRLRAELPGKAFFVVDSDHRKKHVLGELMQLRPLTSTGDYVIVEDGVVNGHPVLPNWEWGDGPLEALAEYFEKYPEDYIHDVEREKKFGITFAPNGFLIRRSAP